MSDSTPQDPFNPDAAVPDGSEATPTIPQGDRTDAGPVPAMPPAATPQVPGPRRPGTLPPEGVPQPPPGR